MDNYANSGINFEFEIDKFYSEFPEFVGKVFIVNPDKYSSIAEFIDDNPEFAEKQRQYQEFSNLRADEGLAINDYNRLRWSVFNLKNAEKNYSEGGYYNAVVNIADIDEFAKGNITGDDVRAISLVIPRKNVSLSTDKRYLDCLSEAEFSDAFDEEILQKYVLYHELGHAIFEQNNKDKLASFFAERYDPKAKFQYETEAAAECYSLIRLVQEYGIDNPTIELIIANRSLNRIRTINSIYNFLPAIDEVVTCANNGELQELTPKQVAILAEDIVSKKVISPEESQKIENNLWRIYSAIFTGREIADFEIKSVSKITEPIILKDLEYVLSCLENTASNNPEIQRRVKKAREALDSNDIVRKSGEELKPVWRAVNLKTSCKQEVGKKLNSNKVSSHKVKL